MNKAAVRDIASEVTEMVCDKPISNFMVPFNNLKFMYIDAYNQPGVEGGKIILKEKLKQGQRT